MSTRYAAAVIGDSVTYSQGGGGLTADQFYPARVQAALVARGVDIKVRNFGNSGDTTAQMVARDACLTEFEVPDLGIIYGGVNDAANGSTVNGAGATTTSIPVQAAAGANFKVGAYVLISGQSVKVTAIATDTLTVAPALSGAPTNTTVVAHDTQTNLQLLAQVLQSAGCPRVMIVGQHYMNWSSGGDTTTVQNTTYAALRVLQKAAAAAGGAIYVDLYTYMAGLITAGAYVQGSFSWHIADSNIHLNATGEQIASDGLVLSMPAQWVADLTRH